MSELKADMSPYTIVLCRVKESGNVGSICRAMKTMGLQNLILADCPSYDEELVAMMAVHALDVFQSARRFSTLSEALQDSTLSAGFSRRVGARRKEQSFALRDFAQSVAMSGHDAVYLVFGNEKDGLSDTELAECNIAVHIPSSDSFPSLNVAQAVQVACYELRMASMSATTLDAEAFSEASAEASVSAYAPKPVLSSGLTTAGNENRATRAVVEAEIDAIIDSLAGVGAFRKSDSSYARHYLIDLCERASLSKSEAHYLRSLFLKSVALGRKASSRKASRKDEPTSCPNKQGPDSSNSDSSK